VKTGDTVDKVVKAVMFCEHLIAERKYFGPDTSAFYMCKHSTGLYFVFEESTLKVICPPCFALAIQLPLFRES